MRFGTFESLMAAVVLGAAALAGSAWLAMDRWVQDGFGQVPDEACDVENQAILRRITIKMHIVDDLIDERMTLHEAAAAFQKLNKASPVCQQFVRQRYAGRDDAERTCRNVIEHVRMALHDCPSRRHQIVTRLERELELRQSRDGGAVSTTQ